MRVITGLARGKNLVTLEGEEVRPTTQRIKEAIFSIIQFDIEGRKFLDLFSGSGQMGIEALSRGANLAVFVDKSNKAINIIKKNLNSTKLLENAKILNMDSNSFLCSTNDKFDIAFLDPPYSKGILQNTIENITHVMNENAIIICEHPKEEILPDKIGDFLLKKNYKYGRIVVTLYKNRDVGELCE